MKLVIGLGNPGEKYKGNRHNVGYKVIDELTRSRLHKDVIVKKTNVFMNQSGEFVKKLVDQHKANPSDLWVIHDDLDIPLGSYKIQKGKGPRLHNGVNSIEDKLGSDDFWRVRVGVDNRDLGDRASGEDYVLQDFTEGERGILDKVVFEICRKLETF